MQQARDRCLLFYIVSLKQKFTSSFLEKDVPWNAKTKYAPHKMFHSHF